MINSNTESDKVVKEIASGANMSKDMLDDLLTVAGHWKPAGYDANIEQRRRFLDGNQTQDLINKLKRDYPRTWDKMSPTTVNYTKLYADQSANSYKTPPARQLADQSGEILDDARAVDFAELIRRSNIDRIMLDAERICMVAKTCFLRIGVNQASMVEGRPFVEVVPFWPSDVYVIPSPLDPTDISLSCCLMARITGPAGCSGADKWYEVWTRPGEPGSYGPWSCDHISLSTGDSRKPFGSDDCEYMLDRLPWVSFSDGHTQGTPYLDVNRDLTQLQQNINGAYTDVMFTCKMQCHSEIVYSGNSGREADFVGGPGQVLAIGANESMTTLNYSVDDTQLQTINDLVQQSALTNRISPDSFTADQSTVQSGISRVVANIPQAEARKERSAIYKEMEQRHLLPIMTQVSDEWAGTAIGPDVEYNVTFAEPIVYEDLTDKQNRAVAASDAGFISPARAAVESGWYSTIDEAVDAGLSDALGAGSMAPELTTFAGDELAEVTDRLTLARIEAATEAIEP